MYVVKKALDKISGKVFRDFAELENLQSSNTTVVRFANMTIERVKEQLCDHLQDARPDYGMVVNNRVVKKPNSEYRWIVNPICGADNLLRSIPYFCTSIALEKISKKENETLLAVVDSVTTKETFFAERGSGAFVNNRRIRVASVDEVRDAVIVVGAFKKSKIPSELFDLRNIKITGCPQLDIVYTAAGKFDGVVVVNPIENNLKAGLLIVKEAGGCTENIKKDILAASASDKIIDYLKTISY